MYNLLKKIYFKLLEIVTLGKGIRVKINGFVLKLPAKYYRLFPSDYERSTFKFVKKHINKGDTIIDIGAHIGLYSVYFAKLSEGRVFSFEPTRETLEVLKKTIEINHCSNVTVIDGAISDKRSRAVFYTSKTEEIATGNSLVEVETDSAYIREGEYLVELYSLDGFADAYGLKIDFIKIDAEGVEWEVLVGASKTFLTDRPCASFGLHPFAYKDKKGMLKKIWEKLQEYRMSVQMNGREVNRDEFCNNHSHVFDVELVPYENK